MPWAFAAVSLAGLAFVVNAFRPIRSEPAAVVSFFAGWLTGELPLHHIAWQAVATVLFVTFGALHSWPGYAGLAFTVSGWAGLVALHVAGRRSQDVMRGALARDATAAREEPPNAETLASRVSTPANSASVDWRNTMWHGMRLVQPIPVAPRSVEVTKNIGYTGTGIRAHALDVYRRRGGPPEGAPVLLYIHGGAWVIGDKREQGLPMLIELARRGWVCVSANYRLSPRATWPDHIVDVKRAICWVRQEIGRFGGDPSFVAISGGSAGGHLAALAALSENDPAFQPGFEDADTSVQACVPLYGVFDMTGGGESRRYGDGLVALLEKRVFKQRIDEARELFEAASPVHRVHDKAPWFFVVHGANDTLVPVGEARRFVKALQEAGSRRVLYAELPLAQHAFDILASVRAGTVVDAIGRFLDDVRDMTPSPGDEHREGRRGTN